MKEHPTVSLIKQPHTNRLMEQLHTNRQLKESHTKRLRTNRPMKLPPYNWANETLTWLALLAIIIQDQSMGKFYCFPCNIPIASFATYPSLRFQTSPITLIGPRRNLSGDNTLLNRFHNNNNNNSNNN